MNAALQATVILIGHRDARYLDIGAMYTEYSLHKGQTVWNSCSIVHKPPLRRAR